MTPPFDPYRKWLGIPASEQPPNHYRLLGVDLFEADLDVIDGAADRQMTHVRTFQHGPHGAESQRLLNELAAARACLCNPRGKAEYDARLRAERVRAETPPPPPAAAPPGALPPGLTPPFSDEPLAPPAPRARLAPRDTSARDTSARDSAETVAELLPPTAEMPPPLPGSAAGRARDETARAKQLPKQLVRAGHPLATRQRPRPRAVLLALVSLLAALALFGAAAYLFRDALRPLLQQHASPRAPR